MSDWLRGLGFTPPIQKANLNGPGAVNSGAAEAPSLLGTNHGVDKFERTTPLFSGTADVSHIVSNIAKLPLSEAKGQLSPGTFTGLENAAKNPNFEFPPING